MKYLKQITLYSLVSAFLIAPFIVTAKNYELLAPIGGLGTSSGFSQYINKAITFTMGAGTGLAVLMIAVGGIQMMLAAGNSSKVGEGKERITQAIYGLVILALSALILLTINPELLNVGLI